MKYCAIMLLAIVVLAGCDGPHQKAGEAQDKAAAAAAGQPYGGDGANERIGKAVDRADRAAQQARDSAADSLRKQGDAIRLRADVGADRLEEQAGAIRAEADQRAKAVTAAGKGQGQ